MGLVYGLAQETMDSFNKKRADIPKEKIEELEIKEVEREIKEDDSVAKKL